MTHICCHGLWCCQARSKHFICLHSSALQASPRECSDNDPFTREETEAQLVSVDPGNLL